MQTPNEAPQARHSAFAAAFLSFLLPGLGQMYAGRLRRGAFFMVPWLLAVALVAGTAVSMGLKHFGEQFADTTWQEYLLVGIGVDLLWRLIAILDAFWVARAPSGVHDAPVRRLGSAVGLLAIVAVLLVSHATVAKPVYTVYDTLNTITGAGPDDTPDPGASIDPTESFIAPQPTVAPQSLAPGASPTPTPEPTPTPVPQADWTKGRLNILLVGTNGSLTDTLIVVSIDPDTNQVAFIGIPRDTVGMAIPSGTAAAKYYGGTFPARVNQIASYAGSPSFANIWPGSNAREKKYDALKSVVGESLGIPIDYYVQVDMGGFRDVVDSLGGAVVDVQLPVYDSRYSSDDGRGDIKLYIPPGIHFMTGAQALAYSRSRHSSSDFDRSARQMRMITALRNQIDIPSLLGDMEQLLGIIKRDIRTDIPPKLLPTLAQIGQKINLDKRISLQLTPQGNYSTPCQQLPASNSLCQQNGIYALVARVPAMQKAVRNVFTTDPKTLDQQQTLDSEAAVVHVLNGTKGTNVRTTNISDRLVQLGLDSTVPPVNAGKADRADYQDTVITAYNGAADNMPETIKVLEDLFGVTTVKADDPSQTADIVVIVGKSSPNLKPKPGQ